MTQTITVTLQMDGPLVSSQSMDVVSDGPAPPALTGQSIGDMAASTPNAGGDADAPPPALGNEGTSGARAAQAIAPPPPDVEGAGQEIAEGRDLDRNDDTENPPPPDS